MKSLQGKIMLLNHIYHVMLYESSNNTHNKKTTHTTIVIRE